MAETVTVLELPDYYIDATLPTNDLDEPNVEAPQAPPSPLMKRGAP
jgi:hypothetical protein